MYVDYIDRFYGHWSLLRCAITNQANNQYNQFIFIVEFDRQTYLNLVVWVMELA